MADIKNYTLNFGCGRSLRELDFAEAKSACAEIERDMGVCEVRARG
ncbi:hypothetical protein O4H66_05685 [Comamonadaceae bacterium G21597-S1]|nr:hypothetical protein [Comamonadaceae bacterium G21597-S1]